MKLNLKIFQKKLTGIKHLSKSRRGEYLHTARDWTIGLGIAALLFIGGATFIALDFYQQFGISAVDIVVENQPAFFKEQEVRRQFEKYAEKERKFNELRSQKPDTTVVEEATDQSTEDKESSTEPVGDSLAEVQLTQ